MGEPSQGTIGGSSWSSIDLNDIQIGIAQIYLGKTSKPAAEDKHVLGIALGEILSEIESSQAFDDPIEVICPECEMTVVAINRRALAERSFEMFYQMYL